MTGKSAVSLEFAPECSPIGAEKALRDGLSVVARIGDTLWVANDETVSVERLTLLKGDKAGTPRRASQHRQFLLSDFIDLPAPPPADPSDIDEVDIEGLAYCDGYLWLVGSHSLKRKKPKSKHGPEAARKRLATVSRDPNRYLLAQIPVIEEDGTYSLAKKDKGNNRHAAQLRGDAASNELMDAMQDDEHLAPFLQIPGKDNGFDIEGLAVVGKRVFLGLRGPVLRGWAVILEVEPEKDERDASILRLKKIGPKGCKYRKHFVDLGSLGVRDLCVHGDDLLILAGPTMDLDGPVRVFRWRGGPQADTESLVHVTELERVLDVPYGDGVDHAEGMTTFASEEDEVCSLLVVYDSACPERHIGECSVTADLFPLPS